MELTSRLNYIFFFFLDFVSNKMSYVRIIICIIYNIQCLRRLRKYPLLIILMFDTERVMTTPKLQHSSAVTSRHFILDYTVVYITHFGILIRL